MNVTWGEYFELIKQLERQLTEARVREWANQLVCLGRGGLIIGDAFSRMWNLPLAVLMVGSYDEQERKAMRVANSFSHLGANLHDKVLILDDMLDTGATMLRAWEKVRRQLIYHQGTHRQDIRIEAAVLWNKDKQKASELPASAHYATMVAPDTWIVQPFENEFPLST